MPVCCGVCSSSQEVVCTELHSYYTDNRTADPVPWRTVHGHWRSRRQRLDGNRRSEETSKRDVQTSSAFQLAVLLTNAQTTLLVKGFTLCDVNQSSHKSFLVRAWPV
jgi:hypothetical protein